MQIKKFFSLAGKKSILWGNAGWEKFVALAVKNVGDNVLGGEKE